VNKTETKLYEKISQLYPTLQRRFNQDWCKKIKHLPYDFCIPEHKIIIELDGRQHFRQVSNWSSPDKQFENDKFKEECANQNDYSVIRLLQQDVLSDRYDWIKKLCDAIEEIKINNENNEITNIYLSEHDEYEQF
jgi:very-short-patch-repair endonuclease